MLIGRDDPERSLPGRHYCQNVYGHGRVFFHLRTVRIPHLTGAEFPISGIIQAVSEKIRPALSGPAPEVFSLFSRWQKKDGDSF